MFNLKKNILLTASFLSVSIFATDYDNAKFDNYVSGQGVNEVLAEAQLIICKLSRLGTKELAGDGAYKATIYADECEAATASATDATAGTTAPSSATTSSSSSTSATGSADATGKDIEIVYVNTAFTSRTVQSTKGWLINDKPWDEQSNREPKNIMYLLNEQTATASDTNKFGDFTLRYQKATFGNTEDDLPEWYSCPAESSREYQWSWCADGAGLAVAPLGIVDKGFLGVIFLVIDPVDVLRVRTRSHLTLHRLPPVIEPRINLIISLTSSIKIIGLKILT